MVFLKYSLQQKMLLLLDQSESNFSRMQAAPARLCTSARVCTHVGTLRRANGRAREFAGTKLRAWSGCMQF